MTRFVLVLAAVAAAVAVSAPVASAGGWLGVGPAKAAIKSELNYYWIGTQTASKVSTCYKPSADRVKCVFQTREISYGEWYFCFGTAVARDMWGWTKVTLNRGWIQDCYPTNDPSFL